MTDIRHASGRLDGTGLSFGIVASRFNSRLVEPLIAGAIDALVRHGVDPGSIHLVRVPGAWEIPQALEELAASGGVRWPDRARRGRPRRDAALRLHLRRVQPGMRRGGGPAYGCRWRSGF